MPSTVPWKSTRGKAGVGLDEGVPARANSGGSPLQKEALQ